MGEALPLFGTSSRIALPTHQSSRGTASDNLHHLGVPFAIKLWVET